MTTVAEAFERCRERLEITKTEQADAIKRHHEVREHLREAFDVETDFLTGSYKRHTKTKPLKDVDIFVVLSDTERHRRDSSPRSVLDAFEDVLARFYPPTSVSRGRRSISITFERSSPTQSEQVLSVDVVPAFACGAHYEIADDLLATWIETDPTVHAERASEKNAELSKRWVPLVKMLKGWNREAGRPIKPSFLIEVMALELVDGPLDTYASEVRGFFAAAAQDIDRDWPDPAGLGPPVSDQMTPERTSEAIRALYEAEKLAAQAARAEAQGKTGAALAVWRQLFGPYFPTR